MTRSHRFRLGLLLALGPALMSACDLLMTEPAPATTEVGLSFQIDAVPLGGNAVAFSKVRRVALRFFRPDSSSRDTVLAVMPVDGVIRAGIALQTDERVPALGIAAALGFATDTLFQGFDVVRVEPGVPVTAEIALLPVVGSVVADADQITLGGPGASAQLGSAALFVSGDTIDGAQGVWLSEDPTTVSVTPTGFAVARQLGQTRLEVSYDTYADTVVVDVVPPTPGVLVTWAAAVDGSWSDGTNWSTGSAPQPGDSVEITLDGTYTVTVDVVTPTFSRLVVGGATGAQTMTATGRTLLVSGNVDVTGTGTLSLTGSTLVAAGVTNTSTTSLVLNGTSVNGPLDNQGRLVARGASGVTGAVTTSAASVIRVEAVAGASTLTLSQDFTNNGAIELAGAAANTATFAVTPGTLLNPGTGTIAASAATSSLVGDLDNRGTITATAGALDISGITLVNAGTITSTGLGVSIDAGTGGFANSGSIDTSGGGDLSIQSLGPVTSDGTIATGGTMALSGGTLNVTGGTLAVGEAVSLTGVTATFGAAMTLGVDGPSSLSLSGSTLTTPGLTVAAGATLSLTGSGVAGPLANQGTLVAQGTSSLGGALTTTSTSTIRVVGSLTGGGVLTVASGFTNAGSVELTNTSLGTSAELVITTGTLSNGATGSIDALAGTGLGTRTISADVGNVGAINLTRPLTIAGTLVDPAGAPSTYTGNGSALTVTGVNVDGGVFDDVPLVTDGGALTLFANATFQNMDPTATQLTVIHPGAALPATFTGLTFATVPTSGLYMSVDDSDGVAPFLTVEVLGSTPVSGLAQSATSGGAVLIW